MSDMFAGLAEAKAKADAKAAERQAFAGYIKAMRERGWSDGDVSEYRDLIRVLMGEDDSAAMGLYPPGVFANAAEARAHAVKFWLAEAA